VKRGKKSIFDEDPSLPLHHTSTFRIRTPIRAVNMAKGARATSRKANNVRLKKNVFGPVENARMERISAKLLELAAQPTPKPIREDVGMEVEDGMVFSVASF
jgi:hypothetical protein